MGAEVIAGLVFNSLALLADAVHMFSDVIGLVVALVAQSLVTRPATDRHTYGLQRAEVMGALINGATLIAAVIWIAIEATHRLEDPQPVTGGGLFIAAGLGLAVNIGSAVVLFKAQFCDHATLGPPLLHVTACCA